MAFKVLILAKYGTLAASTRQRFVQYLPYIEAVGGQVDIKPLLSNAYLKETFAGRPAGWRNIARAYFDRLKVLRSADDYDAVMIYCEAFPYLPSMLETYAASRKGVVIYDFDDAIFHQYDSHRLAPVRWLLGKKIAAVLRKSDIAFCGNAYLQNYADQFCERTEMIPTVVDVEAYQSVEACPPRIGWIGSPSTWQYLKPYVSMIEEASAKSGQPALIVGSGEKAGLAGNVEFADWSEAEEIALIQKAGVGVMPLDDAPWARGKCGYKLIQYMACGLPVIASPVGVNSKIVQHGVNGFLASTDEEWRTALSTLMGDADLRKRMGEAGRKMVEENYSTQKYGPKIAGILQEMTGAKSP